MEALAVFWSQYVRRHRGWYVLGVLCLLATGRLLFALAQRFDVGQALFLTGQPFHHRVLRPHGMHDQLMRPRPQREFAARQRNRLHREEGECAVAARVPCAA